MASFLKQMEELEKLKKKAQVAQKLQTHKGVSSGTPSSMPRAIDNLPKVNASQKAESYGPKQWNKNSNITTLPKAVQTLPRPVNNRLTSALERASKASDLTPTKAQRYRSDNFLKGVGMSFAATVPTLVGVTKQSLSDWHNKIKEEGLQSSLSEMGRNMDNPDWTYGNPVSTESIGYKAYQKANEYFGKAQEGLTPSQQKAMGLAASIAQNAVTLPTAFINPSAPLVIMGANAAANKANELTSQGKTATEALGRGLLSGAIEAATEKLPLDDLLTIAKTGGKSVVKNVLKQMGTEGAEELASYIMNYAADVSSNDKNAKFSAREALDSFLGGAVSGGIMGGAATAVGNMPSYRQLTADNFRYNSILPTANDGYSADVANMDVAINRKISDNMSDDIMPVSEYLDLYANSKNYTRDLLSKNTLALPKPTDYYATSEGITSQRPKESWSQPQEYETVYDDFKTIEFSPSGEFEANDGSLSDTDVKAFYFVKSNAEKKNTTPKKLYEALRKKRKNIVDNIVKENFEIYKQYEPQGTQLIPSTNGQIGGVPVEGYIRVSNNDNWYSEAYARYGHKPNQAQLKEFISLKVEEDVNRGGGEYLDKQTAKTLRSLDTVITGYEKVDSGSDKDVIDIRRNKNGIYEVDYGTPRQQIKTDPTRFYQGRMALQERILPDAVNNQQAPSKKIIQSVFNVIDGTATRQQQGFTDGTYNYYKRGNEWITVDYATGMETGSPQRTLVAAMHSTDKASSNNIDEVVGLRTANINEISDYINNSLNNKQQDMFMKIGEVSNRLKDDMLKIGLNLKGFVHALRDNDIRHIDKSHGSRSNDKYKVTKDDYNLLNDIFNNYDILYEGYNTKKGNIAIAYEKSYNNKIYVVEEVYENGVLSLKQIIKTGVKSKPSFLKKYKKISDRTNANVADSMTRSTDYINSPPGDHVQDVNPITNNIIPQTSENINNSAPKELGERQVMPEAVPKTSTVPDNALGIVPPEVQELFELKAQAEEESKRLYQNTVNGLAPFDRMTKADTRDNRRNISALSNKYGQKGGMLDTILTSGLYDINGNKVDDRSWVSIVSQVPKEQIGDFNTYLQELHNIDRQAQGKPVTEHTADESRKIVADLNVKYPEFKKYQKEINDYLDKFFHLYLVDAGMMTEQAYREMRKKYPNYIPSFRVGEDSGGGGMKPKKKIKNSAGIGKAVGGTSEVMSFDEAVARKMNTVMSAAVKNDISREVFAFAEALPSEAAKNGVLIQNDNNGKPFDIDDVDRELIRKIDKGNYSVTFYNNGKPQTMKISKDVYEAYEFLEDKIGNSAIRWAANLGNKLTSPMKALTTQYNPLFALTNIIRDAQTYTINNTATKPLQAQKNYVKAIAGIIRRSDAYNQYKALGGSQNGYFGKNIYEQAESRVNPKAVKGKRKAIEVLKTPLTAVEKMGEFTEKIPRFAEYLNTVENLGDTDAGRLQASLNAADVTVNFNRSSTLSTLANAWVPYFNAGLQGADKTFRQIKAHPFKTTARATVSVFLPTLLLYLVNKDNPHWKDVKDGVRDGYYLIPNVLGPNSGGYAETFIRVPKSREFGALLSASFERFIRAVDEAVENDKDMKETLPTAFDGYMQTFLNSFMPPDILGDNILGSIARLNTNTAWHGGKIVPSTMENVSPRNQYDINTSQIAMNIAEKANKVPFLPDAFKSPMKVDYLIDSYGGYAGDLLQGLTSRKNIGEDNMGTVLNSLYNGFVHPAKQRFTTDSAYSSYNLERFYNRINELDKAANDRDIDEGLPTEYRTPEEKVLSDFTKARSDIADITKQERAVLERAIPISEKNKEIRQLKQEKNRIAKDILQREDELYKGYTENYIPKLSGLTDDRQEAAKQLYNDYGLTYDEYLDMYDKYKEINDMDVNKRLKATYFEDYLESLGYTDQYNIKPELQDEFSYWNMTPATSYYGSKDYQKVNGILPVETYADLSSIVNGLESNVDYPKGKRSPYVKSLIDRYLERYGYNPTYGERMKIYDSMGVAKGYRY